MTATLAPIIRQRFFDENGKPLSLGKLYTYVAGSAGATGKATWKDRDQIALNTNPIILDADGYCDLWLDTVNPYQFILDDADGNLIFDRDWVYAPGGEQQVQIDALETAITVLDADNIRYDPGFVGAVVTNVGAKLKGIVTVEDFGAVGDGIVNDYAAFNKAVTSGAKVVLALGALYRITSQLVIPANVWLIGAGNTVLTVNADINLFSVRSYCRVAGFDIQYSGTSTKFAVEAGTLTEFADRAVLANLAISGSHGGIQIRNGNCGTVMDVTAMNCTGPGIQCTNETNDNNAWSFLGRIDLRGCAGGFDIVPGASATDPLASKSHSGDLIIVQNNTVFGLRIGSRSNKFTVYAEANAVADILLDTFAYGNEITVLEAGTITDNGQGNLISTHNADADYMRMFMGTVLFDGNYNTGGIKINNNNGSVGWLRLLHLAAGLFGISLGGSGADQVLKTENVAVDGGGFKQWEVYHQHKGDMEVSRQKTQTGGVYGTCVVFGRLYLGNHIIMAGTGSPNGQLTSGPGDTFIADTGYWIKKQGTGFNNTNWVNVTP
jgi:hypothetical protein